MSTQKPETMARLNRLDNALGSQALSGHEISTEYGRSLLSELIDSAGTEDFDGEQLRQKVIAGLRN